jgi:hypothetical protein
LTKGGESFPAPLFPLAARVPLRSGQVFLDEAELFRHNRSASIATLRVLFAFGNGMPFAFPSESVFAFAGILTM